MIELKVKKISNQATIPEYQTKGAACFDIAAAKDIDWVQEAFNDTFVYTATIPTGLAFEIPEGYRMDIYPRSGWGFKYNIQLANGTGKIDSDYRGELMVKLICFSNKPQQIKVGTRIAQGEINPVYQAKFKEVEELSDTERGSNGFGSTGH